MNEIVAYANIEPIGWDVGVSSPPEERRDPDAVEADINAIIDAYEKDKESEG
jgi:hypothetical protein